MIKPRGFGSILNDVGTVADHERMLVRPVPSLAVAVGSIVAWTVLSTAPVLTRGPRIDRGRTAPDLAADRDEMMRQGMTNHEGQANGEVGTLEVPGLLDHLMEEPPFVRKIQRPALEALPNA